MKNNNVIKLLLFLIIVLLYSCAKEDNTQPVETIDFKGTWSVTEQSKDFGASTYNATITDSLNGNYILFAYLYGFNKKIKATVSGRNFIIPSQVIQANYVTGNGTLTSSARIDMKYYVQSTSTHFDTITAVLRK
jgi:hypothetical protein